MRFPSVTCSLSIFASLLVCLPLIGCSSGPGRVQAPEINASSASSQAMDLYDQDGDGQLWRRSWRRPLNSRQAST